MAPILTSVPLVRVRWLRTHNNTEVATQTVTATPTVTYLTVPGPDGGHGFIDPLTAVVSQVDTDHTGFVDLVATDDPDVVETFGWTITFQGSTRPARTVSVPQSGPTVQTITVGNSTMPAVWLDDLADFSGSSGVTGNSYAPFTYVDDSIEALQTASDPFPQYAMNSEVGYSPLTHGGVGDGTTDDTAAVQAALTSVPTAGGVVNLAGKTWKLTAGVSCSNPVTITNGTLLYTPTTGVAVTLAANESQLVDVKLLHDFTAARATAGSGVKYTGGNFCHLTRCRVSGFWNNVEWTGGSYYNITDSVIVDFANYGVNLANAAAPDNGDQTISGCYLGKYADTVAGGTAVHWNSGGGLRFVNNKINAGAQAPSHLTTARLAKGLHFDTADGTDTSVFTVVGNSIENCTEQCIYFTDHGTSSINKVSITGNEIASIGGGNNIVFAQSAYINGVTIVGNTLNDAVAGIVLKTVSDCAITGNVSTGLTTYGVHLTSEVRQTTIGDNRWNHAVTYPFYADNSDQTNDVAYETSFLYNGTTGAVDVMTFGMVNYACAFLDVEITGVVQGVAAVANKFSRVVASQGDGQDLNVTTVGTDVSVGSGMTAQLQLAGRSGLGAVNINETSGSGIQVLVRARIAGAGLKYVSQLVNG